MIEAQLLGELEFRLEGQPIRLPVRKQAWAALKARGPGLILLLGEPGVGKTRLALSFAATFGQPVVLRAQEIALGTPHYPTAEALRNALARALVAAAGLGGAIVFDDLHWADVSSLELVLHLSRKVLLGPRLIAMVRSSELEGNSTLFKALESLRREGRLTRVNLEGLSETEVCKLVQALSGSDGAYCPGSHSAKGSNLPR